MLTEHCAKYLVKSSKYFHFVKFSLKHREKRHFNLRYYLNTMKSQACSHLHPTFQGVLVKEVLPICRNYIGLSNARELEVPGSL
jgi:hypothetical protein